jgi:tetratricopeptide (TPR) repeat protein
MQEIVNRFRQSLRVRSRTAIVLSVAVAAAVASGTGCTRSANDYVESGNELFKTGKFADASLHYRKAIQGDPGSGEAHYRLGLSELRAGNLLSAYATLRHAASLMPDRPDVQVSFADLALSAFLLDRTRPAMFYDVVRQVSTALLAKDPDSADGVRLRGSLALADRKPEEALRDFQRANQLKPGQDQVVLGLTQALFQTGQDAEAEKVAWQHLQKSNDPLMYDTLYAHYMTRNDLAAAEKTLQAKIAGIPNSANARLDLARHYQRLKKTAQVESVLQNVLNSPALPQRHAAVGDFYASVGNTDAALRVYEDGLKADPQEKAGYEKRIVNTLVAVGRQDQAITILDRVLKENPADDEARGVRAAQWFNRRRPEDLDRVIEEFNGLTKRNPGNATYFYSLGKACMAKGDTAAARVALTGAVKAKPDFFEARFALADLALFANDFREVLRQSEDILKIQPDQPSARLLHATALVGSGRTPEARAELQRLVSEYPQNPEAHLQLAIVAIQEGKFKEAEAIVRKRLQTGTANAQSVAVLAHTLASQKQSPQAIALLREAIGKAPNSTLLHKQLARTAARTGLYDVAVTEYRDVLAREPKDANVYVELGDVYSAKGDLANAIAAMRKAQELAPQQVNTSLFLAALLERNGQSGEAHALYRRVLESQPNNVQALNNFAFSLAETGGNLDEALRLAQRAASRVPSDPIVADTLGWIYLKKGMTHAAQQIFHKLVTNQSDQPVFRYHLAAALLQQGNREKARTELEAALKTKPDPGTERKIRELMGKAG